MFKDVKHWCKSCQDCSMRKFPRNSEGPPLLPIPVGGPFERVGVDVRGPFPPSSKNNRYIVVFSDYLTRWEEAFPVPKADATDRHGAPKVVLSTRAKNFLSKLVAEVCKIFQIH